MLSKFRPQWQQTMIRVRDPAVSLDFYKTHFGFELLRRIDFDEMKFSVYFVGRHPATPVPRGEDARDELLWTYPGVLLELTHNHGTEKDDKFPGYASGNAEPYRGFGHICLHTNALEPTCDQLIKDGVAFQKRPQDGRMRTVAFAKDPDGYWIELVQRSESSPHRARGGFTLAQTMLRVRDPAASLAFYRDQLGMELLVERHFGKESGDFSLFFLQSASQVEREYREAVGQERKDATEAGREYCNGAFHPTLELTHNHGTEKQEGFSYCSGNTPLGEGKGFGHIGLLVDDLEGFFAEAEKLGITIAKKPSQGKMRNLGFIKDPDGYSVEVIQRGVRSKDFVE